MKLRDLLHIRTAAEVRAHNAARADVIQSTPALAATTDRRAKIAQARLALGHLPKTAAWALVAAAMLFVGDQVGDTDWAGAMCALGALLATGLALGQGALLALEAARIPFAHFDWIAYRDMLAEAERLRPR